MAREPSPRMMRSAALLVFSVLLAAALACTAGVAQAKPRRFASRSQQIAALKRTERRVRALISREGVDAASYDDVLLADLRSFNIEPLWNRGVDGARTTVAVIEGWDMPGLRNYIARWDHFVGLPNTSIKTIYPAGPLPKRCPPGMVARGSYGDCSGWQGELVLDVEAVHLFAPYAKIVVSVTPSSAEDRGDDSDQVAPPEMMKAVEYLSRRHIANVISISDGSAENGYEYGHAEIHAQDPGLLSAAEHGVPVTNATGDCGAPQELPRGNGFCNVVTQTREVATWADSPFVTAVGGVTPAYDYKGAAGQDSFSLWNTDGGLAASNAGLSRVYARPSYQNGVQTIIGAPRRAVPDITMDGQDGTSEAAPQFAAILALATQVHHRDLGPINPVLYQQLGPAGAGDGVVDVTAGDDSAYGVNGYVAAPGYDIASGWGTVNAALFVPALAHAVAAQPAFDSPSRQAAGQLRALQRTERISPSILGARGRATITSSGFLPEHPVTVRVDGRRVTSVRADRRGELSFKLALAPLKLAPGRHFLRLSGLLLTQRTTFTVAAPDASTGR